MSLHAFYLTTVSDNEVLGATIGKIFHSFSFIITSIIAGHFLLNSFFKILFNSCSELALCQSILYAFAKSI